MSEVYDNWGRLVEAVLKREELRRIALCESLSSCSISNDFSSHLSLDSFHEDATVGNSSTGAIGGEITAAVGNSSTEAIFVGRGVSRAARLFAAPAVAFAQYRRRKRRDYLVDVPARVKPDVGMGQFKRFSLRELEVATENFSNKNFLGTGRFGKVYKGRLADGSLVAVKRLKEGKELSFQKEVEVFGMAVHRNVIRLSGFCMMPTERLLVYPLMVNGSVALWLREQPELRLDWPIRKGIALGSARGLAYLHDDCALKIIHRDVKAANILLDEYFEPVVGDFGLAIPMDYNDTHATADVHGTISHIAPEYALTGQCSEKTDVFSYGVMLLELITAQRAVDLALLAFDDGVIFLDWVKRRLEERKLETMVDENLLGNYIYEEVEQLIQVALLCTQSSPTERPKMTEVIRMLEGYGLAERWEKWQKEEMFRQDFNRTHHHNTDWILPDSTPDILPDELSGPR